MIRRKEVQSDIDATHIKVSVYYDKGGENAFTGHMQKRGIWMLVVPVNVEIRNGYEVESFTAYSGVKYCILEMNRASAKKLQKAESVVTGYVDKICASFEGISGYPLGMIAGIITDKIKESL